MPKARKNAEQHFAVSPWITKNDYKYCRSENELKVDEHKEAYVVVVEDLIPPGATSDRGCNQHEKCKGEMSIHLHGEANGVASEWKTRATNEMVARDIEYNAVLKKMGIGDMEQCKDEPNVDVADKQKDACSIDGLGDLVFLPRGQIMGHFTSDQPKHWIEIIGEEILSKEDCMRDDEWKLIELTLKSPKSQQQVHALVEKEGADAAVLSPMNDLTDSEIDALGKLHGKLMAKCLVRVEFRCSVIKADEAAQAHLHRVLPELVGKDAIVNVGQMEIGNLPSSFLDSGVKNEELEKRVGF